VGKLIDEQRLMPPRGYVALPRRWVVERIFSWLSKEQEDEPMAYERLCASVEVFIYAAMIRLMVRRLVRPKNFQTVSPRTPVKAGCVSGGR
jgi:hypothetical protein